MPWFTWNNLKHLNRLNYTWSASSLPPLVCCQAEPLMLLQTDCRKTLGGSSAINTRNGPVFSPPSPANNCTNSSPAYWDERSCRKRWREAVVSRSIYCLRCTTSASSIIPPTRGMQWIALYTSQIVGDVSDLAENRKRVMHYVSPVPELDYVVYLLQEMLFMLLLLCKLFSVVFKKSSTVFWTG